VVKRRESDTYFSSGTTAYPDADYPVKEEEMWNAPPPAVYFGYGWMRRYLELLGEFVASKSDMGLAICRPTAVYGAMGMMKRFLL
jgi:nucleoside-diphosphate-sugar epimerase